MLITLVRKEYLYVKLYKLPTLALSANFKYPTVFFKKQVLVIENKNQVVQLVKKKK